MLDKIKNPKELAYFVGVPPENLFKLNPAISYRSFYINKPGSSEKRLIEYPTGELERVLTRLCDGLQWLYLSHITEAAYGYIRKVKPCADPRDILTNARRHLSRKYLLNIDLDDFFHQVDETKLKTLFNDYSIFSFDSETENLMTKLVTYKGRLPMGSPASPPLSNFATIALDNDLVTWARHHNFVYTRFVDDLSFSSNMRISHSHFSQISEILQAHLFRPDNKKIKWYGPSDLKEVTGLVLDKNVQLPDNFLEEFESEIIKFRSFYHTAQQYPDTHVFEWLEKMKQVMQGRLTFMKMIYGAGHPVFIRYNKAVVGLFTDETAEFSVSWRYAGYEYC